MLRFLNWIEWIDALSQLDVLVREETTAFVTDLVLPGVVQGDPDPVFGRSVQFEVRAGLHLFCDVDQATNSIEILSIELLVSKTSLA